MALECLNPCVRFKKFGNVKGKCWMLFTGTSKSVKEVQLCQRTECWPPSGWCCMWTAGSIRHYQVAARRKRRRQKAGRDDRTDGDMKMEGKGIRRPCGQGYGGERQNAHGTNNYLQWSNYSERMHVLIVAVLTCCCCNSLHLSRCLKSPTHTSMCPRNSIKLN